MVADSALINMTLYKEALPPGGPLVLDTTGLDILFPNMGRKYGPGKRVYLIITSSTDYP